MKKKTEQTEQDDPKPEALSPEEIASREKEKVEILRAFTATRPIRQARGSRGAQPVIPIPAPTPADLEQLERDLTAARAELAATEAAYRAAVKAEAEIKAQADSDRKFHLTELGRHRDQIQRAADQAAETIRSAAAAEIANQANQACERNRRLAESSGEAARQVLREQVRPWLHEVEFAQRRARELDQQHRRALEVFAAQTVSTSPAEFPAQIRNALSAKVYRPAERVLERLGNFLAGGRDDLHGEHIEAVLRRIVETGTYNGSIAELRFMATKAFTRDGVESIKRQISTITADLSRLYADGRAASGNHQSVPDHRIPDRDTRLGAKREALYGSLTPSRQTTADMTGDI